jgi:hypothetical protein
MDITDAVDLAARHGRNQARGIAMVLLQPVAFGRDTGSRRSASRTSTGHRRPNVPVFLTINAFAGATIGATIPGRPHLASRATIALIVILVWLTIAFLLHQVCRLFGSKEKLSSTTVVMLMLLSVVYVVANLAIFIITGAVRAFPALANVEFLKGVAESPGSFIVFLEFLLTLVLVPLVISGLHGFRSWKLLGAALTGCGATLFLALAVLANGGC